MENKTINNAKTAWAIQLERSPTFEATFTYINHRFDADNKWFQCKSGRNSHILFNVAFPLNKIATLKLERGDEIRVTFKAINRDSTRPSSYKFTAVDIARNIEIIVDKGDEEIARLMNDNYDYYEARREYFRANMNSHKGTFVKAVQDKKGVTCDLHFDMKVKLEDGTEVSTPMAFRTYCSEYYNLGFNGAEGKDFRLWINPGKTSFFFTEEGDDNIVYEKKGDEEFAKYFPALFLESAEKIKD